MRIGLLWMTDDAPMTLPISWIDGIPVPASTLLSQCSTLRLDHSYGGNRGKTTFVDRVLGTIRLRMHRVCHGGLLASKEVRLSEPESYCTPKHQAGKRSIMKEIT